MKPFRALFVLIMLMGAAMARAESPADVAEVRMPILEYVVHIYGRITSGRHHAPVAFVVGPNNRITSLVSGTVRSRSDKQIPPRGPAMVSAMQDGKTIGFTEAEVNRLAPRFLLAFESALTKAPGHVASESTVVLIRNDNFGGSESGETLNPLDQDWDVTLRSDFKKINPSAKLLVIRLINPDQ